MPLRRNHDYDPEWDFVLRKKPAPSVVKAVAAFSEAVADMADMLGLGPVGFHYADLSEQNHLARYVNGTSEAPVIVVDDRGIERAAKASRLSVAAAVQTTLVHELGHAYVDSVGLSGELDDEEALVESGARFFFDTGALDGTAQFIRESVDAFLEE